MTVDTIEYAPKAEQQRVVPDPARLLEAYLELAESPSMVELERRLGTWLGDLYTVSSWSVKCFIGNPDEPLVQMAGMNAGSPDVARDDQRHMQLALACGPMLRGTLDLRWDRTDESTTALAGRPDAFAPIVRVLNATLHRLGIELEALAQSAELAFVRSLIAGRRATENEAELDGIAATLLDQMGVSSLQVVVRGPYPGGIGWGISSRRFDLSLSPIERQNLAQMIELRAGAAAPPHPYFLARGAELQVLQREFDLSYLAQLKSLLVVPMWSAGKVLGAVIAGEARSWARQPISQQAISVCLILAKMIAESVTQSRLLGEIIERGQFMQVLIDSLDDAVLTAKDGHVISWNEAAHSLFGYQADEVLGKALNEVLPFAPRELIDRAAPASRNRDLKRSFEWKMRTTGGHDLLLLCTATELRETGPGSPTEMYVFREVGQERELEYLKDELLSSVSHELRTPLNGIYGFSRLLIERPHMPEEMRREALKSLQSSTERLTRMADDFIDVARARRYRLPMELEEVDVALLVRMALGELRRRHPTHRISLRVQKGLPKVPADSLRVRQILDNLVSNAAKYSPEGTTIALWVRLRGGMLAVSVSDHGCGIPKAALNRIFEAFYRADNSRSQRANGVGLGLSIVKSLVEAHNGWIEVRSMVGKGSTFTFSLPVIPAIGA